MEELIIYLAHSKSDYNSRNIEIIKEALVSELKNDGKNLIILDPSTIKVIESEKGSINYKLVMSKYFFPMIAKCNILVAVKDSKTKKYSSGVFTEIKHAKSIGKTILEL